MTDELVEKLDPVRPHGLSMVAAYRAERNAQRGNLKAALRQSRAALRAERQQRLTDRDDPGSGQQVLPASAGAVAPAPEQCGVTGEVPAAIGAAGVAEPGPAADAGDQAVAGQPPEPNADAQAAETAAATDGDRLAAAVAPAPDLSVFAHLVDIRSTMPAAAPVAPIAAAPVAPIPADPNPEAHPDAFADPPVAPEDPAGDMAEALTTIVGFGPGMVMRLRQLGYHTAGDLADADPERLRQALGNISRLLDVDAWIANAKRQRDAR